MKKIAPVLLAIQISLGFMFVNNNTTEKDNVDAMSAAENLNVSLEYGNDSTIKEKIIEEVKEQKDSRVKSISKSGSILDEFKRGDLNDQFKVEAVKIGVDSEQAINDLLETEYIVNVEMKDTHPPVIDGASVTLELNSEFNIDSLALHAYDVVDGDLPYTVVSNNVNTAVAGDYEVVVSSTDMNNLTTTKGIAVHVNAAPVQTINTTSYKYVPRNTYAAPVQVAALDRNNLNVRGWTIIANDPRVSDTTLRSYMNELQNLPGQYNTSHFTTVYIDLSLGDGYLGMAYSSGKLVINGTRYYATTILHEATHAYDFVKGFANDPTLIQIRNAELNNLPARYSGNIKDDTYEWVSNIVVFYYNDPQTLRNNAPQSYNYVQNVILR